MKLLGLEPQQILAEIEGMKRESKAFRESVDDLGWYLRGYMDHDQLWSSSPAKRAWAAKFVHQNIERVKKTGLPLL